MKESMPSSAHPAQAAQKPRIWLGVSGWVGIPNKVAGWRRKRLPRGARVVEWKTLISAITP